MSLLSHRDEVCKTASWNVTADKITNSVEQSLMQTLGGFIVLFSWCFCLVGLVDVCFFFSLFFLHQYGQFTVHCTTKKFIVHLFPQFHIYTVFNYHIVTRQKKLWGYPLKRKAYCRGPLTQFTCTCIFGLSC